MPDDARKTKPLTELELYSLTPRRGAGRGRRPRPDREGLAPHEARPPHDPKNPVHVWQERAAEAPSFRTEQAKTVIAAKIAELKDRGPRILRYTIRDDGLCLLCEAKTSEELSQRVQLLFSRLAFALNRALHRSGGVFRGRHHREELTTPARVKDAIAKYYSGPDSTAGPHAK